MNYYQLFFNKNNPFLFIKFGQGIAEMQDIKYFIVSIKKLT